MKEWIFQIKLLSMSVVMKGIKVYLSDCAIVKGLKLSQIRELFKPIMDKTFNWTNENYVFVGQPLGCSLGNGGIT